MPKPAATLLLLLPDWVGRVDVAGGREPAAVGAWGKKFTAVTSSMSEPAGEALGLGPSPAKRVWVLSTSVATQEVEPSAEAVAGLEGKDLTRALAFEAEAMGGMPAGETVTGVRRVRVPEQNDRFWIDQAPLRDVRALADAIRKRGGRLAGLLHPAGLPRPIADDAPAAWRRTELWGDGVFLVHAGDGPGGARHHALSVSPDSSRLTSAAGRWFDKQGPSDFIETLVPPGTKPAAASAPAPEPTRGDDDLVRQLTGGRGGGGGNGMYESGGVAVAEATQIAGSTEVALRLEDEQTLKTFLTAWAAELGKQPATVPVIPPPPKPTAGWPPVVVGVLLTVGAAAGGYLHHQSLVDREAELTRDLERVQETRQGFSNAKKQVTDTRRRIPGLEAEAASAEAQLAQLRATLEAPRRRMAALLPAVAEARQANVLVRGVRFDDGSAEVSGLCLSPRDAVAFAERLSMTVGPDWRVLPPQSQLAEGAGAGGPWEFTTTLEAPTVAETRGRR